ncbi:MAG: hypothetical protein HYU63_04310 [Armatimonadetes bacterium]|nr:hypothetical protein [Armatimonadota bacterium]
MPDDKRKREAQEIQDITQLRKKPNFQVRKGIDSVSVGAPSETAQQAPASQAINYIKSPWQQDNVRVSLEGQINMAASRGRIDNTVNLVYINNRRGMKLTSGNTLGQKYLKINQAECYYLAYKE